MNRALFVLALVPACDSADVGGIDARTSATDGKTNPVSDGRLPDGHGGGLTSTLTSSCATLQGRALVNYNGNLGIAFTIPDTPYTFLGSVSFELPDGFTGAVPDPEHWDGVSDREVIAASSAGFETFGNHCWFSGAQPTGGAVAVTDYRPNLGIVKATFSGLQLRSCTGAAVCTITGSIETTGSGVFE